ncbi:MAG: response regulator [Planctomycetota bacterium]
MQRVDRRLAVVVEDDPAISRGVCMRLQHEGFETVAAFDGESGLEQIRQRSPMFVILDVLMPGMNGLELLQELRREMGNSAPPVLMLSASLQDQQAALDAGATYFLTKPYRSSELLDAIHSLPMAMHS